MVTLGIESGREREHSCGTKLHAEAAGFAALDDDGNTSFCHGISTLRAVKLPESECDYALRGLQPGVTAVTDVGEDAHTSSNGFAPGHGEGIASW
jgi:hypothetical protein